MLLTRREDEDASHCAVPISTSLIKQIVNKTGSEDNPEHILADFYGPKSSAESPWPYITKDAERYFFYLIAFLETTNLEKLMCTGEQCNMIDAVK